MVKGRIDKKMKITGYLGKNEKTNKVTIYKEEKKDSSYIETEYEPPNAAASTPSALSANTPQSVRRTRTMRTPTYLSMTENRPYLS